MLPPIDLVAPPVLVALDWLPLALVAPVQLSTLEVAPHSLRAHTSLSPVVRPAASFIPCETKFYKMAIFQPN